MLFTLLRVTSQQSGISAGLRDGHTHDPERADGDDNRQDGRHDGLGNCVRADAPAGLADQRRQQEQDRPPTRSHHWAPK